MTSCNTNDDCTNNNSTSSTSATCPVNGKSYRKVSLQTIMHLIRKPWNKIFPKQQYYFCTDPNCNVVYFAEDNSRVLRNELRESVGQKSKSPQRTICYCFDIKLSDIERDPKKYRQFVIEQTQQSQCNCETRNPSGKCCLKDFPK